MIFLLCFAVLGIANCSDGAKALHPFAVGSWRAPGAGPNVFARESQIDVMATLAAALSYALPILALASAAVAYETCSAAPSS